MEIPRSIMTVIQSIPGIQGSCFSISSNLIECVKKILPSQQQLLRRRNCALLVLCVIAISLDTLFFYIPVISDNNKCLKVDATLGSIAIVLRSIIDGIYLIHVIFRMRADPFLPCFRAYGEGRSSTHFWPIARKYFFCFFPIDLLAILPLPQIVILVIIPMLRSSNFLEAMVLLKYVVLFQYVPRTLRVYQFFRVVSEASGVLAEAASTKAALNLLLYLLASHVLGGLWYFLSIERATMCWQKACRNNICAHSSFYCSNSSGNFTFLDNYCPIQTPDTTRFDFGIFLDALKSGIAEDVTGFFQKFVYCVVWGLQNLSCFGQNLKTSTYFWENCFAAFIIISGLVLFVSLIGNMQTYIQSKTIRAEEMRLKGREIEHWIPFRKLPEDLKEQVKKYQRYKWRETRGVDVENFLNDLPKDLRRSIKRELCVDLLKKVKIFEQRGVVMLDALCDRVTPALYIERNHIIQEGDAIDQMLFVVQGKLWTYISGRITGSSSNDDVKEDGNDRNSKDHLEEGDFCGEALLDWAMAESPSPILPTSTRTIQALTKVEAFVLLADDLKNAFAQYRQITNKAAGRIQSAWRRSRRKKPQQDAGEQVVLSVSF